jgi:hypothetical protein
MVTLFDTLSFSFPPLEEMRGSKIYDAAGELRITSRYKIAYNFAEKPGYLRLDGNVIPIGEFLGT